MVNNLFRNKKLSPERLTKQLPDTVNEAGGLAFSLSPEHALAQYVVTGTFNDSFYTTGGEQLDKVESLCESVDSTFLAKLAVYGRQVAKMKDTPAYLLGVLANRSKENYADRILLDKIFYKVCDNIKMLLNFVQIIRSGKVGRKSFGTHIKKLVQGWIKQQDEDKLFAASIGHSKPSLADTIKMVHPKPIDSVQENFFAYLLGKPFSYDLLPDIAQNFECLKCGMQIEEIPNIPFMALSNLKLTTQQWHQVGFNMPWNTLRMNLNMLGKHGVFDSREFTDCVAAKLCDRDSVVKFNVFPYQLLTTFHNLDDTIPPAICKAVEEALEIAVSNTPKLGYQTLVAVDTSGSMKSPITGNRVGSTSKTRCVDVAALIATSLLRNNPQNVRVVAFDTRLYENLALKANNYITQNSKVLAGYGGGGTRTDLPFGWLNSQDNLYNVILISDNESWSGYGGRAGTNLEWQKYANNHKSAKLVNIDLQPYDTTQVPDYKDRVMNVGGFSDELFNVIARFLNNEKIDFLSRIRETII